MCALLVDRVGVAGDTFGVVIIPLTEKCRGKASDVNA